MNPERLVRRAVARGVAAGRERLGIRLRTRAAGTGATLVLVAGARIRAGESPERAARFAASVAGGSLGVSLGDHVRRSVGRPASGFETFADDWRDDDPSLARAVDLLVAAAESDAGRRGALVDRAVAAALDGVRERVAEFGATIGPAATALYAFGVVLPLALVGLLPTLGATGTALSPSLLFAGYGFVLPSALAVAGGALLARRPLAASRGSTESNADGEGDGDSDGVVWAVGIGVTLAGVAGIAASSVRPSLGPIAALGFGVGSALVVRFQSSLAATERVRSLEASLPDALSLLGGRIADGDPVETALPDVARRLDGDVGRLLADTHRLRRTLGIDVVAALVGERGRFAGVASRRVRQAGTLLALAVRDGRPGGDAVVSFATHLDRLEDVEAEARRDVRRTTDGLSHTAAAFAPLVAGVTVSLADGVASPAGGAAAFDAATLGPVLGWYVLCSAVVLRVLAVGFEHGLDRGRVGVAVGGTLLAATSTFLAATVGASLVL